MKASWLQPFLLGVAVGWSLKCLMDDIVYKSDSYITATSDSISTLHVIQKAREGLDSDGGSDSDSGSVSYSGSASDNVSDNVSDSKRRDELCDEPKEAEEEAEEEEEESMELEEEEEEETQREKQQLQQQQPTSICSAIHSLPSSSTMSIWKSYLIDDFSNLSSIFWASKHYLDYTQSFQDFNSRLLYYMTPQRLQTTIKSIPRNGQLEKVGQILDIAYKRYMYVQQRNNGVIFPDDYVEPRKVQILVMGGSVALGVLCSNVNPVGLTKSIHLSNCAWPKRVYNFMDHLFPDIVDGHIITVGGMNTNIAIELWRYNMIPKDSTLPQEPDILFNAYSTNDMHVQTELQAQHHNLTLEDMVHEMQEEFIRTVLQPRSSCDEKEPPLLLFLDDYLGNEQRQIRQTLSVNAVGHRLSTYYGIGFISYADAVRDFVYGDTDEVWFSPTGWPNRQIHPGMGAHISMMYVVLYNLLNMVTTYCDRLDVPGPEHMYDSTVVGMPILRLNQTLGGEPKPKITAVLPPEMTKDLSLDDISDKWRKAENASIALGFNASECTTTDSDTDSTFTPCTFTWAWNILNAVNKEIFDVVTEPILTLNDGWEETNDNSKRGLTPTKSDAKLRLQFHNLTDTVEKLNFIVMQSYGEKWEGSKVQVTASVYRNGNGDGDGDGDGGQMIQATEQSMEIEGFHAKNTSESFNFKLDLGDDRAKEGEDLVVDVELVGGTTFKIMGMMFCRF